MEVWGSREGSRACVVVCDHVEGSFTSFLPVEWTLRASQLASSPAVECVAAAKCVVCDQCTVIKGLCKRGLTGPSEGSIKWRRERRGDYNAYGEAYHGRTRELYRPFPPARQGHLYPGEEGWL